MFLGEYKHNLTKGNRLALPSKVRNEIETSEIVLARGFEACILGYQKSTWEEISKTELAKPVSEMEARKIRRQLFSGAILIEIDQQGRVVVPKNLLGYAKIKDEAMVIGAGDHFEIWDSLTWKNYKEENYGSP
ncbi:division/cell wall cluster transcriptional repressor MraZ [Microgenomates group bacterium RBG_19FT_COMBO_39_10]|nr:MAG: division/cell wall cluster transcriptional repressor MraZ [Microgenomates group bacterium RBG_19FT_COMBO_39_10]